MEEKVDILDESGSPTGRQLLKSEAHKQGLFHPTVHIWFYTPDARVLIQQRGAHKLAHPLLWDVSVAGHISAGESPQEAGIRETEEEIGLHLSEMELEKVGVFKEVHRHGPDYTDCEFHHTYIALLKESFGQLRKQEEEVADLRLIPLVQLAQESWGLARSDQYVPHSSEYYKTVFKAIKDRL